jgi:hypothetical protein
MKKLLNDFRRWLAQLLMPDEQDASASIPLLAPDPVPTNTPDTADADLAPAAPAPLPYTPIAAQPGLNCPDCGTKITVTIPMLLSGQPFYCTACFLEIRVNHTESAPALNALQKLQGEFQKAEAIVNKSKNM